MMANLTVHEAMPGHMVQLAHARRYRGATKVRQVLASGSFIEGWGVHAEEIMAPARVRRRAGPPAAAEDQLRRRSTRCSTPASTPAG